MRGRKKLVQRTATLLLALGLQLTLLSGNALAYNEDESEMPDWLRTSNTAVTYASFNVATDRLFNTDTEDTDKVTTSNKHALLIADAGVQAPAVAPGETAVITMPLVVNREYLPSDMYFLRNITIRPVIPTASKDMATWPFVIDSISYVRHLDDMTYNSRADVTYEIPIAQTAQKGIYPISFSIYATVWRYDVLNGTDIQEDVEFTVTVYVTVTEDGSQSGVTSDLGALTVVSTDEDGQKIPTPKGNCGDRITFQLPLVNRGNYLTDITITPKVTSSLETFPFVSEAVNYGQVLPEMSPNEVVMVEYDFQISPYATQGNKPVTFEIAYKENGVQRTSEVTSYIYIVKGYEEPKEITASAPSVIVESYSLTVDGQPVDFLYAGQEGLLTLVIKNNDKWTTANKVRIGASIDTAKLIFPVGETDTKYVANISAGKTAEVQYLICAATDAAEGPTNFSVTLHYENWEVTTATASQTLPLFIKQPVRVELGEPSIYDSDVQPGDPIAMSLNIVNKGRGKIYNVSIGVDGEDLSMYEEYYGGDVLPAAKLGADVLITSEQAGTHEGSLLVTFEDSGGEVYTEEVPFAVVVAEKPQPVEQIQTGEIEQPKSGVSTGAIVGGGAAALAAAGGGAWWFLKRRKKSEIS